jgi:hypothetical protein
MKLPYGLINKQSLIKVALVKTADMAGDALSGLGGLSIPISSRLMAALLLLPPSFLSDNQ